MDSDIIHTLIMGQQVWIWLLFLTLILALMVLDLGLLNRGEKIIDAGKSLRMAAFYVAVAMLYGIWVLIDRGREDGLDYYAAYFIEYSLSLDNIFVMSVIFSYFSIPREYQHRVLFWGIIGVILLRGILIALGAALIASFDWILLIFAGMLIVTGGKMLLSGDENEFSLEKNRVVHLLHKYLRVSDGLHGQKFFIREPHKGAGPALWHATPLFIALCTIELADVVFAVDSIPAVFAITKEAYIVFTSNIFAVVGLRTLYFALSAMLHRFSYLRYAVSAVLVFIGGKVVYAYFFGHVDPLLSLGITVGLLAGGVFYSLYKTRQENMV